jgi:hypothetical protein
MDRRSQGKEGPWCGGWEQIVCREEADVQRTQVAAHCREEGEKEGVAHAQYAQARQRVQAGMVSTTVVVTAMFDMVLQYYKRRRPNPLKPPRTAKNAKLPF